MRVIGETKIAIISTSVTCAIFNFQCCQPVVVTRTTRKILTGNVVRAKLLHHEKPLKQFSCTAKELIIIT